MDAVLARTGLAFAVTVCADDVSPRASPIRALPAGGRAAGRAPGRVRGAGGLAARHRLRPSRRLPGHRGAQHAAARRDGGCGPAPRSRADGRGVAARGRSGRLRRVGFPALMGYEAGNHRSLVSCDGRNLIRSQSRNDIVPGLAPGGGRGRSSRWARRPARHTHGRPPHVPRARSNRRRWPHRSNCPPTPRPRRYSRESAARPSRAARSGQIAWMRLRRDKVAMAGGVVVIFLILVAIFGPFLVQSPTLYHAEPDQSRRSAARTARSAGSASATRSASSRSPAVTCSAGSSTGRGCRCSSRSWPPRSRSASASSWASSPATSAAGWTR